MARAAFAIDGLTDIWELESPREIEAAIAHALAPRLGEDVLIYRIGEMQGAYFGLARLSAIYAAANRTRADIAFDDIRMFTVELPHPAGITTLTRLQFLDDDEFQTIVSRGQPAALPRELAERNMPQQPFLRRGADDHREPGLTKPGGDRCAFTGLSLVEPVEWTPISPRRAANGLAGNVLAFSPEARQAFLSGHFSARADLTILVDVARISDWLLQAKNPTGRLVVPDDPAFVPGPRFLADHRRLVFRGG